MPSALIVQRRVRAAHITPSAYEAKCPTIRLPTVLDVETTQESPGGWTRASFTIPTGGDRFGLVSMTQGEELDLPVWLFRGLTPFFHGVLRKVTPQANGEVTVECDGSYRLLGETRMRTLWSDTDLSVLTQAPGSASWASMAIDASGRLVFGFPKDHAAPSGSYIAADYFLFGESVGNRDSKKLDSFKVTVGSASTFDTATNLEVRVYGMASPSDTTPVLLQTIQNSGVTVMHVSDATHGAGNVFPWPIVAGFRCIRVGLWAASATSSFANDKTAVIPTFQVSTRGRVGVGLQPPSPTTSTLAQDIWTDGGQGYDLHAYAVEEYAGTTGGSIVGAIADSGKKAFGINYKDWSTPQEIVEGNVDLDGFNVAMYGPTKSPNSTAHMVAAGNTSANYWYRQPAELTYEAWNDLGDPDYHVRLGRGATWEPDGLPDDLASAVYVNYQSLRGQALSVFSEDATSDNIVYEQGLHKAADWQIDPSVDTQTATTLAGVYTSQRRQPFLSGRLTVYGDQPGTIELPGGARCRLVDLRLGVVRIVDARGPKAGRITSIVYTPRSSSSPEQAVLTVNSPAAQLLDLQTARAARRAAHKRNR